VIEKLLHYSHENKIVPHDKEQIFERGAFFKPEGLWVSVVIDGECDWRRWCESDWPSWMNGKKVFEVVLAPDANMLHISSTAQFDQFNREFRTGDEWFGGIDWTTVASKYDGIIIAPYQWSRRLDSSSRWYYGWDAASGCIWNARAIASITRIKEKK
jgi:hypothetical protein